MIVSRKKQPTLPSSPIMIKGASLERVTSYKYLGVWFTPTLNWSLQVTEVCKKARRQLGMLYRRFYGHIIYTIALILFAALFNTCASSPRVCCSGMGPSSTRSDDHPRECPKVCTQGLYYRLESWI